MSAFCYASARVLQACGNDLAIRELNLRNLFFAFSTSRLYLNSLDSRPYRLPADLEMSASSQLDSLGNCVVCGIRTATRCSECASNGTEWMFFCSRDHQRIVRSCPALPKLFPSAAQLTLNTFPSLISQLSVLVSPISADLQDSQASLRKAV